MESSKLATEFPSLYNYLLNASYTPTTRLANKKIGDPYTRNDLPRGRIVKSRDR